MKSLQYSLTTSRGKPSWDVNISRYNSFQEINLLSPQIIYLFKILYFTILYIIIIFFPILIDLQISEYLPNSFWSSLTYSLPLLYHIQPSLHGSYFPRATRQLSCYPKFNKVSIYLFFTLVLPRPALLAWFLFSSSYLTIVLLPKIQQS